MNDQTQAVIKAAIHITNVIPSGTGFAVTADGQSVFIPKSVAENANIKMGDEVEAKLVANHADPRQRTPYMAVYIERHNAMTEAVNKCTTEDILTLLEEGYLSTQEVAAEVGIDSQSANAILNNLHAEGRIVKAAVYAKPNQQRASLLLWARSLNGFIGE